MRNLLLLLVVLTPSIGFSQVAKYNRRIYTPQSFPRAISCNCSMCVYIRSQWKAQGWGKSSPSPIFSTTSTISTSPIISPTTSSTLSPTTSPTNSSISTSTPTSTSIPTYTLVTKTRQVPYTIRVCHGTYCTYETRYKTETYTERVPTNSSSLPSDNSDLTAPAVARAVMEYIQPTSSDILVDLGCGEGALLAAAAPFGCSLIGVESDKIRANKAAWRIPSARIVEADLLKTKYKAGTIYVAYLFPDLLESIIPKLPSGTLLVSLEHQVSITPQEHTFQVNGKTHSLYIGIVP